MKTIVSVCFTLLASSVSAQDAARGQDLFQYFCSGCHGEDGSGGGPMASVLLVQPTNLTKLSKNNGGTFPIERAARRIDGRDALVSHGSDMPVFGWLLEDIPVVIKMPSGQSMMADRPVADLLTWLESIQSQD